jgi:hypothetical protein
MLSDEPDQPSPVPGRDRRGRPRRSAALTTTRVAAAAGVSVGSAEAKRVLRLYLDDVTARG